MQGIDVGNFEQFIEQNKPVTFTDPTVLTMLFPTLNDGVNYVYRRIRTSVDTEAIPRTPVGFGSQRERRLDCTVDQGTDPGFGLLKSFSHLDPLTCTCAFAILNCYLTSMIYLCHALQTSNYNLVLPLM